MSIYGLILAGGKSTRMGQDKSVIAYHGKPQIEVAFDLLSPWCANVFLSTRRDQSINKTYNKFSLVEDDPEFEGKGPLSGILSAMKKYPSATWLVIACDLPFVHQRTIEHLIKNRNPQTIATAYKSSHDALPEPLCAVWEGGHYTEILKLFQQGLHCPRKILIQFKAHLLDPLDANALDNINDPQEYNAALKVLSSKLPDGSEKRI